MITNASFKTMKFFAPLLALFSLFSPLANAVNPAEHGVSSHLEKMSTVNDGIEVQWDCTVSGKQATKCELSAACSAPPVQYTGNSEPTTFYYPPVHVKAECAKELCKSSKNNTDLLIGCLQWQNAHKAKTDSDPSNPFYEQGHSKAGPAQ